MKITFDTNCQNEVEIVKRLLAIHETPQIRPHRASTHVTHVSNALHDIDNAKEGKKIDNGHLRSADVKILEGLSSGLTRSRELRKYAGLSVSEWQVATRRLKRSNVILQKGLKSGAFYRLKK